MIKYNAKGNRYEDEDGNILHTGHNIEWNRKVSIGMTDAIWFGAFKGKTPKELFGSSQGTSYLNWMKGKGFNFSTEIQDALEVGRFVHDDTVPDFLVANNKSKSVKDEITMGEPMLCTLGQDTFMLFDQDLANTITIEGQSVLAKMVETMARQESRNIITANPEAGRNYSMIY